ncbi:MAG: 50S ribosomal protein L24 [Candidatus Hydrogenedentes bacterium]|nr:50S ribosomal protein L24 [Candidatus Hydrogenedentota bacterium]
MDIRKGDTVVVITGKYKGRKGRVLRTMPAEDRLIVEGVNMMKRHTRPSSRNQQGGIVERERPIHVSNVMAWCEAAGKASKIIRKRLEDGSRVRVFKVNGETISE